MRIELDEKGFLFRELAKIVRRSKDLSSEEKVADDDIRFLALLAMQMFVMSNIEINSWPDRTDEVVGTVMLSKAKVIVEKEKRLPVRAVDIMDHMVPTKEK